MLEAEESDESLCDTCLLELGGFDRHGGVLKRRGRVPAEQLVASGSWVDTHDKGVNLCNLVVQVKVQSRSLASRESEPDGGLRLVLVQNRADALGERLHHRDWLGHACVLAHLSLVYRLLVVPSLRLLLIGLLLVVPSLRLLLVGGLSIS